MLLFVFLEYGLCRLKDLVADRCCDDCNSACVFFYPHYTGLGVSRQVCVVSHLRRYPSLPLQWGLARYFFTYTYIYRVLKCHKCPIAVECQPVFYSMVAY